MKVIDLVLGTYALQLKDHRAPSGHSLRLSNLQLRCDSDAVEQEYWVSTHCVIVAFMYWSAHRRTHKQSIVLDAWLAFLHTTVAANFVDSVSLDEPSAAHAALCDRRGENLRCPCVDEALALFEADGTPQRQLQSAMLALYSFQHCKACTSWLGHIIQRTSTHIEVSRGDWGDEELLKSPDIWVAGRANKRRRANPYMKDAAINRSDLAPTTIASNLKLAKVSTTQRWLIEFLAEKRTACLAMSKGFDGVLSSALDAARVGRPAQDFLAHTRLDHNTERLMCAPPMVPPAYVLAGEDNCTYTHSSACWLVFDQTQCSFEI